MTSLAKQRELLEKHANDTISDVERTEPTQLRTAADRLMLRNVQVAALLRWRGHHLPPADK